MKKRFVTVCMAIVILFTTFSTGVSSANAANVDNRNVVLTIPWSLINQCGSQSVSGPCMAYCWAYCRIIIDNQPHTYRDFWAKTNEAVGPSNAGYNDGKNVSTTTEMLRIIYDNINSGHPVMLHVRGTQKKDGTYNNHYVVAIGYRAGSDPNNLSQNDILILNPSNRAINSSAGSNETYTYLSSCTLTQNRFWTVKSGTGGKPTTTSTGVNIATPNKNPVSPQKEPEVVSVTPGNWKITVPANYKLVCYDSASAAKSSTYYIAAKVAAYTLTCTQQATLSNGKTRYFFVSGDNKNLWFDYTNSMSATPSTTSGGTSYTVTFDANEGNVSQQTKTVAAGSTIGSMPTPIRTGYIFMGWCTAKEGSGMVVNEYNYTVNQNQTLYALWQKETTPTYTVTFDPNGGSVSQNSKTLTYGSNYGTLPTPTRNGYTFDGWYTSADGGSLVTSNVTVRLTYNQTLYAHWSENPQTYTLYFNPDGGWVDINSKEVTYGEYYGDLPTPYREGYKFEGWYTDRNGSGSLRWSGKYVTTKADETVYAHWSLIDTRISVHLDTNGGPDHGYIYYYESNDTYGNLPSTEWVGYTFEGWYSEPSGGTKIYSSTRLLQNSEHTLYAHWTEEETPPEPSSLSISGLRVTVSGGKIRASATVTSNYDLMDFTYSNGAAGGGLGSVGKNKKIFEYTYEVDYTNLAYDGAGTYTFWLTCTDMSGNSATATYDYYLPGPNASQSNTPQYFSCNVGIFCVNGKTVNLYNNPGDSKRVDYFSLGQSVGSTYGVNMPDGTTWYQVSVTSKGNIITVWLKYESDKMTVRNLG